MQGAGIDNRERHHFSYTLMSEVDEYHQLYSDGIPQSQEYHIL